MVIRYGLRRFLYPLAFYAGASALVAYFLYHAHHGERGFVTKQELTVEVAELTDAYAELKDERIEWEERVALMRREEVDRDLLEERARATLGRIHKNDVVIIGR